MTNLVKTFINLAVLINPLTYDIHINFYFNKIPKHFQESIF